MSEEFDKTITDEKGRIVLRLGLIATWYFSRGHTAEIRTAVLECFNEYNHVYGARLRWWVVEGKRFNPVAKLANRDLSPYLTSTVFEETDQPWAFFWHGGERKEDASEYRISGFAPRKFESESFDALSFLSITVPLRVAFEDSDFFLRLVGRWSERLRAVHGYGGIGLVDAADAGVAAVYEDQLYAFAVKHPGAEVDKPLNHALWTKTGIKGVNWITVLSDPLIERAGGMESLRKRLPQPIAIVKYDGGTLIVAGPRPELGDRNRQIDTPLYRRVAQVLRPLQILLHPAIARSPEGKFDSERFTAWLRRFAE